MSGVAGPQQLATAAHLWERWQNMHVACTRALSSATNIVERLQVLMEAQMFDHLKQHLDTQGKVIGKQLASLNTALEMLHKNHDELQSIVKDLERLHIEALRKTSSSVDFMAIATPSGPEPTMLQCTELLQDMWTMCRDELLLKVAAASLLMIDTSQADGAALLQCYSDQPNIDTGRIDRVLAQWKETAPQP